MKQSDERKILDSIVTSTKSVSVDEFVRYMEQEFHWKNLTLEQESEKSEKVFLCSARGGRSVINELKRTAKEIGVKINVTPIDNLKSDPDHLYKVEIISGVK